MLKPRFPEPTAMDTRLDSCLILRAALFAAEKHRHQRRKDAAASPYINHPLAVAAILAEEGGIRHGPTLIAALLHDTLEDTATSLAELEAIFGTEIAAIVVEVSDDQSLSSLERKQRQILKARCASTSAKLVKLADKIANLRDLSACPPTGWDDDRKREYFDWAAAVVEGLRGTHAALERAFDREYQRRP